MRESSLGPMIKWGEAVRDGLRHTWAPWRREQLIEPALTRHPRGLYKPAIMVGVQDLPSELIFKIIDLALSSPAVSPTNGTRHRPSYEAHPRNLYCVPSLDYLKNSGAMNLLLSSQRMYHETKEYLSKAPRNFEVDIAVIDDHWFWPTRRVVPLRKVDGIIDRLDINVIPCCTAEGRHLQTDWDRDHPVALSTFWTITMAELMTPLTNFLINDDAKKHVSDVFRGLEAWVDPLMDEQSDDGRDSPVTWIDTVTINVNTWKHRDSNDTISTTVVPFRKIKGLSHLDFAQLYPIGFAKSETYLRELRKYVQEWTLQNYSTGRATRKIRRIQFYLDGELSQELNSDA
jgi:hypothetical protein